MKYHPEQDDQQADQEHEYRNPVDPVHVFDPGTGWLIWISFPEIEIFGKFL